MLKINKLLVFLLILFLSVIWNLQLFDFKNKNLKVFAITSSELKSQKDAQAKKLQSLEIGFGDVLNQKNTLTEQKNDLENKIQETETLIQETETLIANLQVQKTNLQNQIDALIIRQRNLIQLQQEKNLDSKDPIAFLIKSGVSSTNIGDFFGKMYLISNLENEIQNISDDLKNKKQDLENNIKDSEDQINKLAEIKTANNITKQGLEILIAEYGNQEAKYAQDIANQKAYINSLQSQIVKVEAEEQARQKAIEAENARKKAQEQANNNSNTGGNNNTNPPINNGPVGCWFEDTRSFNIPSGFFARPTNGDINDIFGCPSWYYRGYPNGHDGVDIGGGYNDSINSIADGQVVSVGWQGGGWGNYVVIMHSVPNEQSMYSLYAHLASINTFVGQSVAKNQRIGGKGCTGRCTGTHLHIQLMAEDWYLSRGFGCVYGSSKCINPVRYIPI